MTFAYREREASSLVELVRLATPWVLAVYRSVEFLHRA
jgi:hypothetical protein